jgi:hypothetical protein
MYLALSVAMFFVFVGAISFVGSVVREATAIQQRSNGNKTSTRPMPFAEGSPTSSPHGDC